MTPSALAALHAAIARNENILDRRQLLLRVVKFNCR
jgi:hypothetical protein